MEARENRVFEIDATQIAEQYEYQSLVRRFFGDTDDRFCYIDTYGCQQNEADSEILRGMAYAMGYQPVSSPDTADLILVNTCAIREHAEQRVFGNLGALSHIKKRKKSAVIALCGCMAGEASVRERIAQSFPHVSIVFNPHMLWRFPELLYRYLTEQKRILVSDASDGVIAEGLPVRCDRAVRGWLPVMYGCDNFCSYCIVPYVRGRERSRRPERILADAKAMLEDGYRDITLLGQNVNSYDGGAAVRFPDLLRRLNRLHGPFRLRFMTSHPKDAGAVLFDAMRDCEKVSRHLHLPFQSGSDAVLQRMNRGYTAAQYRTLIEDARARMPGLAVTSDVIVGFPGETEDDFAQTMELIRAVRFDALFTFQYSPRPGTRAAEMRDTVPPAVVAERFQALLDVQNDISREIHAGLTGQVFSVLADGEAEGKPGHLSGRTDGGRLVVFPGDAAQIGMFLPVRITAHTTWSLAGEQMREESAAR